MKKVVTLSVWKATVFGFLINTIITGIISYYAFDVIEAFSEDALTITRNDVMTTIFPSSFIIITSVLLSFTLLSMVPKKKEK